MITDTSRAAYKEVQATTAPAQRERLLELYQRASMTDREASALLGCPCSTISARRNELAEVQHIGYLVDPTTHKTVRVWGLA